MAVAGVLDKTTDTPLTPAGEDDHSGPASSMCQARPDKDEQEEEEMEHQEEEDEEGAGMASNSQPLRARTLAMMLMLPLTLANDPGMDRSAPSGKITLQG
ncbi:metalloreductase STEAP4-like isoform X2 [Scomber scombrus]|uniref:Metalloreductase STEAP4-like isoform X2 n=1 Tax=Scomber scombrus TaxID=13677 RepID=A0AAV1Q214_SCOSC